MCRIEQFDVVYPNGIRERREQLNHCRLGTRSQPCRHAQVLNLGDRLAAASDLRPALQPRVVPIEPRRSESSRLRPSNINKLRGPIEGMTLNIKFWNPFSSKSKEKKEKTQYYSIRRTKKPEPRPAVIHHQPSISPSPKTHFVPSVRGESPVIIPFQPPDPVRKPRRSRPTPVVLHQSSEYGEDESPSPPEVNREHSRRTRSLSPISRYHVKKEIIREREFRQRERQEEIRREEREARERAERIATSERQQLEREEQSERQERLRQEHLETGRRQRLAIEREARRQEEEREQEEALIRQERETRHRRQVEERVRILQEQEDLERLRAANRRRQFREEQARRHREEEDERRRAADLRRIRDEQARRQFAEHERLARARHANIPRPPHHPVFVHQNGGHIDRGERVIRDAIREENLRQFERRGG